MPRKLLKRHQLAPYTGDAPESTLYDWMARNDFPRPIRTGGRSVAWLLDEVEAWQAARIAERDAPKPRRQRRAHSCERAP